MIYAAAAGGFLFARNFPQAFDAPTVNAAGLGLALFFSLLALMPRDGR